MYACKDVCIQRLPIYSGAVHVCMYACCCVCDCTMCAFEYMSVSVFVSTYICILNPFAYHREREICIYIKYIYADFVQVYMCIDGNEYNIHLF